MDKKKKRVRDKGSEIPIMGIKKRREGLYREGATERAIGSASSDSGAGPSNA